MTTLKPRVNMPKTSKYKYQSGTIRMLCAECGSEAMVSKFGWHRRKYCSDGCARAVRNKRQNERKAAMKKTGMMFGVPECVYHYKILVKSAKLRKIPMLLSQADFNAMWNSRCHYCDEKLSGKGIDRRDSNGPYSVENCVPCCGTCNMMKRKIGYMEFIERCRKIGRLWSRKAVRQLIKGEKPSESEDTDEANLPEMNPPKELLDLGKLVEEPWPVPKKSRDGRPNHLGVPGV